MSVDGNMPNPNSPVLSSLIIWKLFAVVLCFVLLGVRRILSVCYQNGGLLHQDKAESDSIFPLLEGPAY